MRLPRADAGFSRRRGGTRPQRRTQERPHSTESVMELKDKVAVVTGASAGLGRAFAQSLAAEGMRVYGLARRSARLDELGREIGPAFRGLVCDVTNERDVASTFETIQREAGRVDVLVANAGLGKFAPITDVTTDDLDVQLATNVRGLMLTVRAAVPMMKAQNAKDGFGGHVVTIASVAGLVGNANLSVYNATKFAVRGLSEALMKELRGDGIKVTCFYPGSIATEFADVAGTTLKGEPMQPEDLAATLVHVLNGPDRYLISEVVMRPLRPAA